MSPATETVSTPLSAPFESAKKSLKWVNSFHQLGDDFYTDLSPRPLTAPYWVSRNRALARELGLEDNWLDSAETLAALSGNQILPGTQPLASVYSGHQFGVWAGQLGDGRALLLGEIETPRGPQEIQLKGAGSTPYSRMGDGRAVLRSSIREFLASEAMHGLGIPTTRALCLTGSDAPVRREEIETAAVVTRTAPSFIRFGHFEHFSYSNQHAQLRTLADYVMARFYPECQTAPQPYAALLQAVSERTAHMMAGWQAVGFCHGVMNTDNMSILGLTIDYGPFQFLDGFDPAHICNHSDTQGRYAFNQQPNVAYWNLFCLAQALLPLIGEQETAIAALQSYKTVFPREFDTRMGRKLGLDDADADDRPLIDDTLRLLAVERTDWTIFWRRLADAARDGDHAPVRDLFIDGARFDAWLPALLRRRATLAARDGTALSAAMRAVNPKFVLRNHLGQQAIEAARQRDFSGVATLLELLESPFEDHAGHDAQAGFPPDWASTIEISCSS